jgi:hypothetical protein
MQNVGHFVELREFGKYGRISKMVGNFENIGKCG